MLHHRVDTSDRISSEQLSSVLPWRKVLAWTFKVLVTLGLVSYIGYQFWAAETEFILSTKLKMLWDMDGLWLVMCASAILMASNWALEVVKWKLLLSESLPVTWRTALKGVLSGVSVGVFTPNRLGEFVGRVLALAPNQRISGALLSFINGVAQTLATLTFGILALSFLFDDLLSSELGVSLTLTLQVLLIALLLLLLLMFFRVGSLTKSLTSFGYFKRYKRHFQAIHQLPRSVLAKVYHLSLLRFATFLGQYLLLFALTLQSPKWLEIIGSTAMTLLSSTMLPFIPVPDLLLRESFALSYFGLYSMDVHTVSLVVFMVWAINVAVPAVIGTAAFLSIRIFRKVS